ncbi:phospholipase-like protein, partial [Tanacetum coccineum]
DPKHGNWWLEFGSGTLVGYWPASLFTHLRDHASMVQFGGEVVNSRASGSHTYTQMGSGHFSGQGFGKASYIRNMQVVDWGNNLMPLSNFKILADHPNCYDIRGGLNRVWGNYIYYGGPGRQMLLVGGETENFPLYYHMYGNFQIQFGREEFCLVTGLKFEVEYSDEYDDKDKPIPFRRRVFPSCLDGKRITGKDVEDLIESKSFKKLDDDDAVSLCCIGILQLVLLGLEDRRAVLNWILRLTNDRDSWDDYPWGSYVWPTLYYQLRDANVKRWLPLYATEQTNEDDKKSYSIFGFTWAFKIRAEWILYTSHALSKNSCLDFQ